MEFKDQYIQDCKEVKGKGVNLGHMKNYIMMGLFVSVKKDKDASSQDKELLESLIGKGLRDTEGCLSTEFARSLEQIVAYCQVVRTKNKKKGFINILLRGEEGSRVMRVLETAFEREGKKQGDPAGLRPVHRDLRDALVSARAKGRR